MFSEELFPVTKAAAAAAQTRPRGSPPSGPPPQEQRHLPRAAGRNTPLTSHLSRLPPDRSGPVRPGPQQQAQRRARSLRAAARCRSNPRCIPRGAEERLRTRAAGGRLRLGAGLAATAVAATAVLSGVLP